MEEPPKIIERTEADVIAAARVSPRPSARDALDLELRAIKDDVLRKG
jgi:hypothetical protein